MSFRPKRWKRASVGAMVLAGAVLAIDAPGVGAPARPAPAGPRLEVLHTYRSSTAWEIVATIPVSACKLAPLLPAGYQIVPASAVGLGAPDQGILAITNFQGVGYRVDHLPPHTQIAIDVLILIAAPADAALAGVDIPGAFHLYTLAIFTDDPVYAASLHAADMPVRFVHDITYDRQIDDPSGIGSVTVAVPSRRPFLRASTNAFGYQPAGAFDTVFWFEGHRGTAVLHFHDEPFAQGQALSQIYTETGSALSGLLAGGGLGACAPDPTTGAPCVTTPAQNLRYPQGSRGQLSLIKR